MTEETLFYLVLEQIALERATLRGIMPAAIGRMGRCTVMQFRDSRFFSHNA
jgi:hypothetical protein